VLNHGRNVLGMMPHPDRSSEALLGSTDGFSIFQSMIAAFGLHALSGVAADGASIGTRG
jgi:phosphoribosylformylglycinamidine synthase